MKISCQSCQSKYNVADEKVQGKIVKIRCRKCGATIVVNGTGGAATNGSVVPEPAQHAAPPEGGEQWHVNVNENDQRTMSMADLVEAYNAGAVTQETFIWTDGMDDWKPLSDVDAVVAALHAYADQGAAGGQGQIYAASVVPAYEPPEPEAAPPPARTYEAPAPPQSYGSSAAYGAQAQAVPASEPRRAAVVKREARGRDLFGATGGDDVQTSAPSMPQATSREADDAASKLTGERNENSVLFSLAVLTQAGDERPAHEAPSPTQKDDSGLIDLKALAARTESMRPIAPKADGDVFAPPLGFTPAPLGAPIGALGGGGDAQPKSKLPLFIGLGAGALLLVIVSVVVTVKVAASNAPVPSATVMAAPAAPTTAEPAPSATAEASATASAAPSASAAAKPKAVGGGGGYHPAAAAGGAKPPGAAAAPGAPASPAAAAPAAPVKKNDCGCNGDLMCLMKCSTH
ncbi:MAG: zinc-ribbon domain-containing protein [Polyangiaceae bacterium]